jgi:hypothetical protein
MPFAYQLAAIANLALFARTKDDRFFRASQPFLMLPGGLTGWWMDARIERQGCSSRGAAVIGGLPSSVLTRRSTMHVRW